jgi:4-amino-4-deoxy-L-arabinose transferase-like glycosyltransferase
MVVHAFVGVKCRMWCAAPRLITKPEQRPGKLPAPPARARPVAHPTVIHSLETRSRFPVGPLAAFALSLVLALFFQGARGLWDPDEGRYSNVALQMVDTGDYLTPRRNDETMHVTKPPVTYWAIAASVNAFGRSEWSLRLPMALAFALTVALVYSLGKTLVPGRAWLPALVYVSCPLPFLAAGVITTDTLLTFVETAAMLAYVRFRFGGGSARWLDAMWALFGLAFMVKGPPGLLPLLAIAVWEVRQRSLALVTRPVGLVAFAVIGLSWFAWIIHRHPELLPYFVGDEVVGRIASTEHNRNGEWYGGFMVYLPTLLLGALPWTTVAAWRRWRDKASLPLPAASRFLWLWLGLPLLVFFLARSRLPFYLLPLFVPVSLLVAMSLARMPLGRASATLAALWLVALLGVKLFVSTMPSQQDARGLANELRPLLPAPPTEMVFVQTKARYGLRFYLGSEVETISLDDLPKRISAGASPFDDDLTHELAEGEPGIYYLVPADRAAEFEERISESGRTLQTLGEVRGLGVYAIDPSAATGPAR